MQVPERAGYRRSMVDDFIGVFHRFANRSNAPTRTGNLLPHDDEASTSDEKPILISRTYVVPFAET